ncbi:hypothetical protein JOE57_001455 [Microlunatus panaciterrae]|uniref:BNR/Asp-box repeat-containing protein n=1 Tax=Microlunatus panaciterrae TaxID=400768 RepID=A0ABS2RHQ2_9ACTN|nr:hypothetical protein [Microlunatus panaciterrae]MBM7798534.1 hypothetical protein [Microlunatus panaciterrae]
MKNWAKDNVGPIIAIAALLLLNVVLIALLLGRPAAPVSAGPADPSSSSDPSDSASAEPSDSPSPQPSAAAEPSDGATPTARTKRLISVASDSQGWRATIGDCDTPGRVEVTEDGGQSWTRTTSPELGPVTRIKALDGNTLFAIGGMTDCKAEFLISYSNGAEWEGRNANLRGSWYLTPRDRTQVHAAGGDRSRPCKDQLNDLAASDDQHAAVLCSNGSVLTTADSGKSWNTIGTVAGASALGADGSSYVAAGVTDGCNGVTVTTFDAEAEKVKDTRRCAPVPAPSPADIAVAKRGSSIWVWAGPDVAVSRDSGKTW